MKTHSEKTQQNKSQAVANSLSKPQAIGEKGFKLEDNRPEAVAQRKLREMIDNSPKIRQLKAYRMMTTNSPQIQAKTQPIHIPSGSPVQLATKIKHAVGKISVNGTDQTVGKAMKAELDPKDPLVGSGTGVNSKWMQWLRSRYPYANVIRGHLLNHDLGGLAMEENLYPISTQANVDHSNRVEQNVKAALTYADSNKGRVEYNVRVNEKKSYEQAEFVCDWKLFDKNNVIKKQDAQTIPSNLATDRGGFGGGKKDKQSPPAWYHGNSRGGTEVRKIRERLQKSIEKGKIELNAFPSAPSAIDPNNLNVDGQDFLEWLVDTLEDEGPQATVQTMHKFYDFCDHPIVKEFLFNVIKFVVITYQL